MTPLPRATCPGCARSMSLPGGRFSEHLKNPRATPGSHRRCDCSSRSPEDARLLMLDEKALVAAFRAGIAMIREEAARSTTAAAFYDLEARAALIQNEGLDVDELDYYFPFPR